MKDIRKQAKSLNKQLGKKRDYISPDVFCKEFLTSLGIGDSAKYKLDHYYDVSHEFLGMLAEVMKLTMDKMFKQPKAHAEETEVDSPTLLKKYQYVHKVLHDELMTTINNMNWAIVIRKNDYSFSKPMEDLDCIRIRLRQLQIEQNPNVKPTMFLPFTNFQINVTTFQAFTDMFPGKELKLEPCDYNRQVREHSVMKGYDSSLF